MNSIETQMRYFVEHGEVKNDRHCDICKSDQARFIRSQDPTTGKVITLRRCDPCTQQFGLMPEPH